MALSMMSAPIGSSVKVSGDQDRRARCRPKPWEHADQRAQEATNQREAEVLQARCRRQAREQMLEGVHRASLSKSERVDRQRHLEPVEKDMEDAEASRQRGEQNRGQRARAKRKKQTRL